MQHPHRKTPTSGRKRTSRSAVLAFAVIGLAVLILSGGTAYALRLENHDEFCASCHTQPETRYYDQSLQKDTPTLAAFHAAKQVRCIDCHSGGGLFGRSAGLMQGARDLIAYYSGHYANPAMTTSRLGDDACVKCHSDVLAREGFNNHFHAFLTQWQSMDANAAHCVDCHTSHPSGDPKQSFLSTSVAEKVCAACHAAAGGEE